MLYQEKYEVVVGAILGKPNPSYIELTIASDKNLKNKLTQSELSEILEALQDKEKVIVVQRRGPHQAPTITGWEIDKITGERLPIVHDPFEANKSYDFALKRLPEFENWYSAFLIRIKTTLDNMDKVKLKRLSLLIKQINSKFQTRPDIELTMPLDCEEELSFLKDKSIIPRYINRKNSNIGFRIRLELDVDNYTKFLPKFRKTCLKRFKNPLIKPTQNPSPSKQNNIQYEITFNDIKGEILLNKKKLLSKPNFGSENESVIRYLINNPNKKIAKKDIENAMEITIGKTLHKIVDNLGFAGNLKTIFFKVSAKYIFFRNPVTKSDFEKLTLPTLKIT